MVVPTHREGGQDQFVAAPLPRSTTPDTAVQEVLDWMGRHLDRKPSVADLATMAHMSVRTFARRFRDVTGTTPGRWLLAQRLDRARELLEGTDEPMDVVAAAAGFGSAITLRHHFQRALAVSPSRYRETFRRAACTSLRRGV
jgi:transcriptional regulator GlxA family with amidase domain